MVQELLKYRVVSQCFMLWSMTLLPDWHCRTETDPGRYSCAEHMHLLESTSATSRTHQTKRVFQTKEAQEILQAPNVGILKFPSLSHKQACQLYQNFVEQEPECRLPLCPCLAICTKLQDSYNAQTSMTGSSCLAQENQTVSRLTCKLVVWRKSLKTWCMKYLCQQHFDNGQFSALMTESLRLRLDRFGSHVFKST